MFKNELVTICITTYNREKFLQKTVESILKQTYTEFEIIIVDDYSTDGTQELIENYLIKLDTRIRYIRHEVNKGLAAGRNSAIFNAKGKYFTFCDDDDEWEDCFIEEFIKVALLYNDKYCFCFERELNCTLKEAIYNGFTPPVASQFYYLDSLINVKGYNTDIKSGVDHDLWLRLSVDNIRIIGIRKSFVKINTGYEIERMTTNSSKRMKRILESLEIWKEMIEENFSPQFYIFFKKNQKP